MSNIKLGCHVGMAGKEMFLASAKEAASYGANVFMLYTGAPQNTRRKDISELNIDAGWEYAHSHGIDEIVVHAPYIINLANTVKPETSMEQYQSNIMFMINLKTNSKTLIN